MGRFIWPIRHHVGEEHMTEIVLEVNSELHVNGDSDRHLSDLRFEQGETFVCISGMSRYQLLKVVVAVEAAIETLDKNGAAIKNG